MHLDDQLKQLLRELGQAINETVSDSERILEAIASLRAQMEHEYDPAVVSALVTVANRLPISRL